MSNTLVITDEEAKTTWRMPRELLKDLKRYALENDTNVTEVVLKACREFLAKDKMFKDKYRSHLRPITTSSKEIDQSF
jgi:hypothetical protein